MKTETKLRVFKDGHNFASAHILPGMGKCERLHGHNYYVTAELCGETDEKGAIIDFNAINPIIAGICNALDHKTLLAEKNDGMTINRKGDSIKISLNDKKYQFPAGDCVLLPVTTTTVEKLSAYILGELLKELTGKLDAIDWIEVGVREGAGQMALARKNIG
ncbi:hypothetical protein MNBD_NITROSPINAE01-555 [hydrothermal vent metagenome]|uniref:6-carboxytetrahydropterin synthase n=1 Tax=hydrothermal vent metagenome TaxID=652676 RepID=A0A3B1C8D1_9ZZZZ